MASLRLKEKDFLQEKDDMERSRQKIQAALKIAKERSKKNQYLSDDIDIKFGQLQSVGVKLSETLRDAGLDQYPDWLKLTERMCQLLVPLEKTTAFMTTTEERDIRQNDLLYRQTSMMELTRIIGRKLLFEGKHSLAVPAGIHSLRFSIDVHGMDSVNLVPSYIILGEASIGLGKLSQADEYLAQAEWTVLKSRDATDEHKCKLYRNMGLLYAAKGDYENSLRTLSEDIFHASTAWSPSDIRTSAGYFHMANVFFRQNKMDIADSLYGKVTDIWFDFLHEAVKKKTVIPSEESLFGLSEKEEETRLLDEAQEAEALQMLNAVHDMCEQAPKQDSAALSKICHTLSMLYFMLDDITKAQEFGKKAISASEHLPSNIPATSVTKFLEMTVESEDQKKNASVES